MPGDELTDQELRELVWRDDLTGLFNRRYFAHFMKQEADWSPGAPPLALCMIDLDNLKRINDRLGHMSGDAVLKRIGGIFHEVLGGKHSQAIRYAGDEFVVILKDVASDAAATTAEKLRAAVASDKFEDANLPEGLHPSLSVGLAMFPADAAAGGDDLTEAADKALYYSKRTGKNKVTLSADIQGKAEVSDLEAFSGFPSRTLVGRKPAFQQIDDAISTCLDGKNGLLLVEGDPGSGKTRLLAELARYSRERDLAVLIEKCSEVGREEPYKALSGLLDAYLRAKPALLDRATSALSAAQRDALVHILPSLDRLAPVANPDAERPASERPAGPPRKGPPSGAHGVAPGPKTPPNLPRPGAKPGPGGPRPASTSAPAAGPRKGPPPAGGPPAGRRPGEGSGVRPRKGPPPGPPGPRPAPRPGEPPLSESGRRPALDRGESPPSEGHRRPERESPPSESLRRPERERESPPSEGHRRPERESPPSEGHRRPERESPPSESLRRPERESPPSSDSHRRPDAESARPGDPGSGPNRRPSGIQHGPPAIPGVERSAGGGERVAPTGIQHGPPAIPGVERSAGGGERVAPTGIQHGPPAIPGVERGAAERGPSSGGARAPRGPSERAPVVTERPASAPRGPSERAPAIRPGGTGGPGAGRAAGRPTPTPGGEPRPSAKLPAVGPPADSLEESGRRAGARPAAGDSAEVTVGIFTGLLALLDALSKAAPLVIVLDDIEHADEATFEVLTRLLPREGRVLVVGAARTKSARGGDDAASDPPYVAFRRALGEHPSHTVVTLVPLDREQTSELAGHLLAGFRPPAAVTEKLFGITKGNPLFVEGALRHLIDTRTVVRVEDGWRVDRDLPAALPLTVDDLIRGRLKIVDPEMAELIREAAVVGPNFEFEVVRASLGKPEGPALDLVAGAVKQKLVRETGAPTGADYEFPARAEQEATYESLAPEERQEAHRRVAEALVERVEGPDGGKDEAAIAWHFGRAGDQAKRDRFAAAVRERRELVFDREAVESLGDGRRPRIPEITEVAPPRLAANLPALAKSLVNAVRELRAAPDGKAARDAVEAATQALNKALEIAPAFTISHRGNSLVLDGRPVDKVHAEGPTQEALVEVYRSNAIKSLTFLKPVAVRELGAVLLEAGKRAEQTALPRWFWSVFSADHDLRTVGVAQKAVALQHRGLEAKAPIEGRLAEGHQKLVLELIGHLATAVTDAREAGEFVQPTEETVADLDRALRQVFQYVPALAIHEGDEDALVVNGSPVEVKPIAPSGPIVLALLREVRLRGFVILRDVVPQELTRFVHAVAHLTPGDPGPLAALGQDGSYPNIIVGDGLLQLARDLLGPVEVQDGPDAGASARQAPIATTPDAPPRVPSEEEELMPPVVYRDADLPAQFEWPSDALAQRAFELTKLTPPQLLVAPGAAALVETLEQILLEGRMPIAFRLIDRMAASFTSSDPADRRRAADMLLSLARKGTVELRASYFAVAAKRLGDALELETDGDTFERLAECAHVGILERVAEGDWDVAARYSFALGRRRDKKGGETRLDKIGKRVLAEAIEDPRADRLFETIEGGSQQERRKAARVIEGMGAVAVDRLVRALKRTGRGRVEAFLIDMLAALAPDSETALLREITPFAPGESTCRLLRAAAVVCRDATPVLIAGLQNPDSMVQTEAVATARSVGGKVAQGVLRWALQGGPPTAQLAAVKHLGDLARPDAVDELLDLVQRTNIVEVQRECCLAFGKLSLGRQHHEKVIPVLANFLRPGSLLRTEAHEDVRAAAAWALGQMRSVEGARKALERALEDKDKRVRLTARLTLEGKS